MQLIGCVGKAGSGKSTVAQFLVSEYGYEEISFASTLKCMLAAGGFPEPSDRNLKEANIEGFDFSWRFMAQTLGTEWGRACLGDDIWVKIAMRNLLPDGKYVFSDIRFANESFAITQAGGAMIRLYGRQADLGALAAHASEQPLIPSVYAHKIFNDGSMESLYANIRGIAEGLQITANREEAYVAV